MESLSESNTDTRFTSGYPTSLSGSSRRGESSRIVDTRPSQPGWCTYCNSTMYR